MDAFAVLSLIPISQLVENFSAEFEDIACVAPVTRAARALRALQISRAVVFTLKAEKKVKRFSKRKTTRLFGEENTSLLEDTLCLLTNSKMLLGILVLLLGIFFMTPEDDDRMVESGILVLDTVYSETYDPVPSNTNQKTSWEGIWHSYRDEIESSGSHGTLEFLKVHDIVYHCTDVSSLRSSELVIYTARNGRTEAQISMRPVVCVESGFNLITTMFVILVMLAWNGSFDRDHRKLVIEPTNRMLDLLRHFSVDPRVAIQMSGFPCFELTQRSTEIEMIEQCIGTFSKLLKVGFGEAGMNVIARNFGTNGFDPIVAGVIVKAVFGFCEINQFEECCMALNENTLVFANKISDIVHETVEVSGGNVNKNLGGSFLSVWKLKAFHGPVETTYVHHLTEVPHVVDNTLRSFLETQSLLRKNDTLGQVNREVCMQNRLPGYSVQMCYGLHLGWAVEGAVGSEHKVDATYLSPNVNIAARLQTATRFYGVNLLMSNALVSNMTTSLKNECRPIDRVTVKGSIRPITLYCHMPSEAPDLNDAEIRKFLVLWEQVFLLYTTGSDWPRAVALIAECLKILPYDQPSQIVLEVMASTDRNEWAGHHALTSK